MKKHFILVQKTNHPIKNTTYPLLNKLREQERL